MTKLLAIITSMVILSPFSAFAGVYGTRSPYSNANLECALQEIGNSNYVFLYNKANLTSDPDVQDTCDNALQYTWSDWFNANSQAVINNTNWYVIERNDTGTYGNCAGLDYQQCSQLADVISFTSLHISTTPSFGIPANLAGNMLSSASDTLGDPGTFIILTSIIALGVLFWIIGEITTLFPGVKRGKKRTLESMDRDLERQNRQALKDLRL